MVKWGCSSGKGMAYCPGPLIKTTFPLPTSDLEISLAFPVSAASTVARESFWQESPASFPLHYPLRQ